MLVDIKWNPKKYLDGLDTELMEVVRLEETEGGGFDFDANFIGNGEKIPINYSIIRLEKGVYASNTNLESDIDLFSDTVGINRYGGFHYGVSDNVEQILEYHSDLVNDPDKAYILSVSMVCKEDQPKNYGWRWHKWGEYIGTRTPQFEYLYDEPEIEEVLIFNFIEVEAPAEP